MVFPVVTYWCKSWTIKKVGHRKTEAFKLWCWRRLLRVPWTTNRSNQSILKEINPEYSFEGLTLKLQFFGHLMWKSYSLENSLTLGKTKANGERGNRGWDSWIASLKPWSWHEQTLRDSERQWSLECCSPCDCRVREYWATEQHQWTTIFRNMDGTQ